MSSEASIRLSVVSVVEDVLNLASRKEEEAAMRRYEAASWLRKMVGVVGARDLPEEPTEEEFRLGLRNGIVLCNALNKVKPGAIPKVVEVPADSDGVALSAYQYFENLRNFLDAMEELGLPTFEASDLERGGKGSRVVNSVLALKSHGENKHTGKNGSLKHGGILKPSSTGKYIIRRNSEPFMNSLSKCQSVQDDEPVEQNFTFDFSIEGTEMLTSPSLSLLVRTILTNKKPEEIPLIVESMLSNVMQEFERRIASQDMMVKTNLEVPTDGTCSLYETNNSTEIQSSDCEEKLALKKKEEELALKRKEVELVLKKRDEELSKRLKEEEKAKNKLLKQVLLVDRQKREIQELKNTLVMTKASVELIRTRYSQEFTNLGKHVQVLAHAASGYHKVLEENRKLYNEVQDLKGNIRVYCRVRPFLPGAKSSNLSTVSHLDEGNITIMTPSKYGKDTHKSFKFNRVFSPSVTQAEVFSDMRPLIRSILDGYNVCIFAYGQTGSGKTFTMSGPKELTEEGYGVNYRALNDLFQISKQRKDTFSYEIAVQMIEIYNEQVRDLLNDGPQKRLEIRNNSQKGIAVPDANLVPVSTTEEVIELMNIGQKNRAVCSTAMNDRSSRSHSCLTIHVQARELTSGVVLRGSMHLVDLAGSERVSKSEVTGDRLKEAAHINKSLAALGDVISALAQKNSHVPYRNSKLTQLLQDSLGGQAKTLMFVHISPEADALSETISTLKFAERVSTIELGAAQANKDNGEVKELRQQVASLKAALSKKEGDSLQSVMSSPDEMKSGATSPSNSNPMQIMEDFGNIEEVADIDLQAVLRATNDEDVARDWDRDNINVPDSFYQAYIPDVRVFRELRSGTNSVATDDSDDLDFATSDSLEQDTLSQSSQPKSSNAANGGSRIKRSGPFKSSDIRTSRAHMPSPSKKISNTPSSQTANRAAKQVVSSGVDVKRRQNGKTTSAK
ncbi:kinesin-4 isoform X1 [Canna indica]|uniref:Kinesin-like protein n=1 Tax=Canna indica TaxID=4628 RepID=A0AAQ3L7E2_9LILI|nr:kinesin-4 isoform X1 [Canna indica]